MNCRGRVCGQKRKGCPCLGYTAEAVPCCSRQARAHHVYTYIAKRQLSTSVPTPAVDAATLLQQMGKGCPVPAIVEQVASGSSLRLTLLPDLQSVFVGICGVTCPSMGRRPPPTAAAAAGENLSCPSMGQPIPRQLPLLPTRHCCANSGCLLPVQRCMWLLRHGAAILPVLYGLLCKRQSTCACATFAICLSPTSAGCARASAHLSTAAAVAAGFLILSAQSTHMGLPGPLASFCARLLSQKAVYGTDSSVVLTGALCLCASRGRRCKWDWT